jgi:chromosomal replication initiation ATPase DnaA
MSKVELTQEEIITLKNIAHSFKGSQPKFIVKGGMYDIAHQVCRKHEITIDNLKSKERTRDRVIARIEFTKRCASELNKSMSTIGKFLNRDHTTAQYYKSKKYKNAP